MSSPVVKINPVPVKAVRRERPVDTDPGTFASLPLLIALVAGLYGLNYATSSVERWESIKTYPERFSFKELPSQLYSVLPSTPEPVLSAWSTIQHLLGPTDPTTLPLDAWLEREEPIAWKALLRNVFPDGTKPGTVVASPSTSEPNYWYQWTRDSALVMRTVVDRYTHGKKDFHALILEYVYACYEMQHKETEIGGFTTGGLGEVKYHVDYEPFRGEWGRPQNDGPASRVITLVKFAQHQLQHGSEHDKHFVRTMLYDSTLPTDSIIKGDLEHIAKNWAAPGFDLWEEVSGSHFYTLLSIQTALFSGSALATQLDDPGAAAYYTSAALKIGRALEEFWDPRKEIIRVTLNHTHGRDSDENAHEGDDRYGKESELDAAVLLAILHAGEGTSWEGDERVFSTLENLMGAMSTVYPLNANRTTPALGRYPEDRYDGVGLSHAHPWFLCTLSAAELLFRSSSLLSSSQVPLRITPLSRSFYARFLPVQEGTLIRPGSREMRKIVEGEREMGDGFVRLVQEFASRNGSLHEQFDRISGVGRGARDLTWSYAAMITATQARRESAKVVLKA